MKKYLLSLLAVTILPIAVGAQDEPEEPVFVKVNPTNFPDDNFRQIVQTFDNNPRDGKLSQEEIAAASNRTKTEDTDTGSGELVPNILDLDNKNISNLKGLEYFTSTRALYLRKNNITSIDLSALTELVDLRIAQVSSEAGGSNLAESGLDVSKNTKLSVLYCAYLGLESLDVSQNPALKDLQCNNNSLTSINVDANENLQWFICSENPIDELNVSNNLILKCLECHDCNLSAIDVSENTDLNRFYCWDNNITNLDVSSNTAITDFRCSGNPLKELDVTKLSALNVFECTNCELTTLDLTQNTALTNLHCTSNHLATLDLSQNTKLTTIDVDGQTIESDAYVLDRKKIAIEITPSINLQNITTEMFTNLTNGDENTFTFTDGEQEYFYDEDSEAYFLVIAKPTTENDIDLRNQVVKYEFNVQNPNDEEETMRVTVTIPYPYIMYVNPLTETEIEEVGDPTQGGIAEYEKFYSGTIYLDYDSYVDYGAELYAATGIEESNLEDMLHGGQNPTPKQIVLQKSDLSDILPSETPAYVKTWEPGYYGFNRFVETKIEMPQVKQVRKAPAAKSKEWETFLKYVIETAAENFEGNKLQGTLKDLSVDYQSVLTLGREMGIGDNGTGVVGFWRYRGDKVAAHRAYLPADLLTNPDGGDVKGLALKFVNDATGIRQIESNEESGAWYNLQGVQMAAPTQKGIYIRNGKKLIVR